MEDDSTRFNPRVCDSYLSRIITYIALYKVIQLFHSKTPQKSYKKDYITQRDWQIDKPSNSRLAPEPRRLLAYIRDALAPVTQLSFTKMGHLLKINNHSYNSIRLCTVSVRFGWHVLSDQLSESESLDRTRDGLGGWCRTDSRAEMHGTYIHIHKH